MEKTFEDHLEAVANFRIGSMSLSTIVFAVLVFALCFLLIRVFSRVLHRTIARSKRGSTALSGFLESAAKIFLWVITAIILADILGIPTTSLVAVVSVVGLALSLSIQNIASNLFSGVMLLITKPFEAENYVEAAGKAGTVKSVGLFYTVLETPDNIRVYIPNGDVTSSAVINYSAESLRRVEQSYAVSYDSPTEEVLAAIREAAAQDARILTDPAPFAAIKSYQNSSIEFVSRVWCKNSDYWDVFFGMNERVRRCFDAHGVEMTYQHLNVHLSGK